MSHLFSEHFIPLHISVLTVSDTRTNEDDTSGQLLVDRLTETGHYLAEKIIVKDNIYQIRKVLSNWIASHSVQVVLTTGGTGFTQQDSTPEAVKVLLDKEINGFGELFRQVSFEHIGTSTIQSRAIAGIANGTLITCMPGSTNACHTAWEQILLPQLDARHKPCNFVPHLKQSKAICDTRS